MSYKKVRNLQTNAPEFVIDKESDLKDIPVKEIIEDMLAYTKYPYREFKYHNGSWVEIAGII